MSTLLHWLRLRSLRKVPVERQRLIYGGRALQAADDERTLTELGVGAHGRYIHLVPRPDGPPGTTADSHSASPSENTTTSMATPSGRRSRTDNESPSRSRRHRASGDAVSGTQPSTLQQPPHPYPYPQIQTPTSLFGNTPFMFPAAALDGAGGVFPFTFDGAIFDGSGQAPVTFSFGVPPGAASAGATAPTATNAGAPATAAPATSSATASRPAVPASSSAAASTTAATSRQSPVTSTSAASSRPTAATPYSRGPAARPTSSTRTTTAPAASTAPAVSTHAEHPPSMTIPDHGIPDLKGVFMALSQVERLLAVEVPDDDEYRFCTCCFPESEHAALYENFYLTNGARFLRRMARIDAYVQQRYYGHITTHLLLESDRLSQAEAMRVNERLEMLRGLWPRLRFLDEARFSIVNGMVFGRNGAEVDRSMVPQVVMGGGDTGVDPYGVYGGSGRGSGSASAGTSDPAFYFFGGDGGTGPVQRRNGPASATSAPTSTTQERQQQRRRPSATTAAPSTTRAPAPASTAQQPAPISAEQQPAPLPVLPLASWMRGLVGGLNQNSDGRFGRAIAANAGAGTAANTAAAASASAPSTNAATNATTNATKRSGSARRSKDGPAKTGKSATTTEATGTSTNSNEAAGKSATTTEAAATSTATNTSQETSTTTSSTQQPESKP